MFYRTDPTGRARAREPASEGALGTSDLLVPLARGDQPPAPAKPDSAMRDARGPPTTREEYVALIADAIADAAARAPPARRAVPPGDGEHADRDPPTLERLAAPSARAGRWTVYAVSDLHADVRANADWARALPVHPPFSALIVAGDVATSPATVVDTLAHLKRKFEEVFFCPGNHEMWTPPPPNEHADAGHPPDSLGKLKHLIQRVSSIGVRVAPTLLPGSPAPTTPVGPDAHSERGAPPELPASVVVVPMLSWYDDAFGEVMGRGPGYSPAEAHFDAGCSWPACVGRPGAPRDSHPDAIAAFFVDVNARVGAGGDPRAARRFAGVPLNDDDENENDQTHAPTDAVSFSHFVPRPSLYRGTRALAKVMGSATLGSAVKTLRPAAHVFGHSHGDVDETVDGTRYVQRALGYPNERWGGWGNGAGGAFVSPARVWPPSDRRRDVLDGFAACALA